MCKAICYSRNQGKLASVSTGVSTASPGEQYSMTMYVYLNVYALASVFLCMGTRLGPGCSANRDILRVGLTPILTLEIELWSNSCEVQLRILLQAPSRLWSHGLSVQSPHTPHISIVPVTLRPLTDWLHRLNTVFPSHAGTELFPMTLQSLPLDLSYHLWKFLSPSRIS